MFKYYCSLGLRSLRRNPALTALMVLTLAIGVAASMSTLTVLHVMSNDPIPHKSARLFVPVLDNRGLSGYNPQTSSGPNQLTYRDAVNLLAGAQGERRTAMYGVLAAIEPGRADMAPRKAQGLAPTRDFFAMFETPFLHGQAWSEQDDQRGADVVVLGRELSEALFGNANPVGQRVTMFKRTFQVVGVLDHWRPMPRYYDVRLQGGSFGKELDFMMPFASAIAHQLPTTSSLNCSESPAPGFQGQLDSECHWIHFWYEARSAGARSELLSYLDAYTAEQGKLGRFPRHAKNALFDVPGWMEYMHIVRDDNKVSAWVAFGFLLLCLVNTVGLLLAKFSARAAEVGIRRALGASRRAIFSQFLLETAVIGLAGGLLGLLLSMGALALIGMQSETLGVVAHMDPVMLALTIAMSIAAAVLAGLLPTWRACQITPAMQLKSQ